MKDVTLLKWNFPKHFIFWFRNAVCEWKGTLEFSKIRMIRMPFSGQRFESVFQCVVNGVWWSRVWDSTYLYRGRVIVYQEIAVVYSFHSYLLCLESNLWKGENGYEPHAWLGTRKLARNSNRRAKHSAITTDRRTERWLETNLVLRTNWISRMMRSVRTVNGNEYL